MRDCLSNLGSVAIPNDDTEICTNEVECLSSGESVGSNPQVKTSNYCVIGQANGCAVVVANKLSSFGFPGL